MGPRHTPPAGVTQPARPPGRGCGSPAWRPSRHTRAADTLQTDQVPGRQLSPRPQSPPGKGSGLQLRGGGGGAGGAQSAPSRRTLAGGAGAAKPLWSQPTPGTLLTPCHPKGTPQDEARPLSARTPGPGGRRFLGAPSTVRLGLCSPVGTPALQTRPTCGQTQPQPPEQTRGPPGPSPCWPQGTWTAPRRGGR